MGTAAWRRGCGAWSCRKWRGLSPAFWRVKAIIWRKDSPSRSSKRPGWRRSSREYAARSSGHPRRPTDIVARLAEKAPLPVNYILYSQSAYKLETQLERREQISAVAYPREAEQVFIVTLTDLEFPPALKNDLRPGLTGRAKIQLGREPLIVWTTKRIVDWLRLRFIG